MGRLKLKLITFDAFNTIIRIKGGSPGKTYAKAARQLDIAAEPKVLDEAFMYVYRDMKRNYPVYGVRHGMTAKQWWGDIVRDTFHNSGYRINMLEMEKLSSTLYENFMKLETWELCSQSEQVLQSLKKRGLRLAVISNCDERLHTILSAMKLQSFFDFIVTSHECQYEKPDPRIFTYALDKAGVSADEVAHVGDDLKDDYLGARNVGMHSFLLDHSNNFSNSELENVDKSHIIKQLSDVEQFL